MLPSPAKAAFVRIIFPFLYLVAPWMVVHGPFVLSLWFQAAGFLDLLQSWWASYQVAGSPSSVLAAVEVVEA